MARTITFLVYLVPIILTTFIYHRISSNNMPFEQYKKVAVAGVSTHVPPKIN